MRSYTQITNKAIHFIPEVLFFLSKLLLQKEISKIMEYFSSYIRQNYDILPHFVNLQESMIVNPFIKNLLKFKKYQRFQVQILYQILSIKNLQKETLAGFLTEKQNLMQKQEHTSLKEALSKEEVQNYFSKMFEDQINTECFQCGKKSKQWAERNHAIFLCLNCAALYKQFKWACQVKSIGLDLWSKKQLQTMARGGNRRFKEYLTHYEVQTLPYDKKLKTKAAQYYRILLVEEANGRLAPEAPSIQEGQKFVKSEIPLTQMSPQEILQLTKEKALWLGSKTLQLGGKAATKIQQKVTSGQLKQDAKKVANQVKTKAKDLWRFASSKIKQLTNKNQQPRRDPQL